MVDPDPVVSEKPSSSVEERNSPRLQTPESSERSFRSGRGTRGRSAKATIRSATNIFWGQREGDRSRLVTKHVLYVAGSLRPWIVDRRYPLQSRGALEGST